MITKLTVSSEAYYTQLRDRKETSSDAELLSKTQAYSQRERERASARQGYTVWVCFKHKYILYWATGKSPFFKLI